jgi:hypothetical protein
MQKRTLTINFERSVTAGIPNTIEVAIAPLSEPNAPSQNVTLVGGTQTQIIVCDNEVNPAVFELVPTDAPELSQRILYRIAWRQRYLGRQYVKDFVMPDFDCSFDDLEDLGSIIGGETYLQWTDRGNPGGVAALNSLGQVLDGDGNPVGDPDVLLAQNLTGSNGVTIVENQAADGYTTYDFQADDSIPRRYAGPVIPASGNFGTVVHNLGTTEVVATFRLAATRDSVTPVVWKPNADGNTLGVMFDAPPLAGQYWAVVIG